MGTVLFLAALVCYAVQFTGISNYQKFRSPCSILVTLADSKPGRGVGGREWNDPFNDTVICFGWYRAGGGWLKYVIGKTEVQQLLTQFCFASEVLMVYSWK